MSIVTSAFGSPTRSGQRFPNSRHSRIPRADPLFGVPNIGSHDTIHLQNPAVHPALAQPVLKSIGTSGSSPTRAWGSGRWACVARYVGGLIDAYRAVGGSPVLPRDHRVTVRERLACIELGSAFSSFRARIRCTLVTSTPRARFSGCNRSLPRSRAPGGHRKSVFSLYPPPSVRSGHLRCGCFEEQRAGLGGRQASRRFNGY